MRKIIFLLVILFLFQSVQAVSLDIKNIYSPKETVIGEFSEDILTAITKDQVNLLRDGHIDVAFEYDVTKLGNKNYLWLTAPQNPGNYTLKIKDLVALVEGVPQIVDYEKNFRIEGTTANYSISPGFILSSKDFEIKVTSYASSSQIISVSFPENREVNIIPGVNSISFDIGDLVGTEVIKISVGEYSVPAYLIGAEYVCGDGRITGREKCDGEDLGGNNCTTISEGYAGGELACSADCLRFDKTGCELPEECGPDYFDLCLSESNCTSAGGYWYNSTCHKYGAGATCDSSHLDLCQTRGTCLDADGYWYNDECNSEVEQVCGDNLISGNESCDGENLGNESCASIGYSNGILKCKGDCSWFNVSACEIISSGPPMFVIKPGTIKDTVLIQSKPTYSFSITNLGPSSIKDLYFDYDAGRFVVYPNSNVSLGINETEVFNLTLKNPTTSNVRGVVVAYSGETFEYLLFTINITNNEDEVGTGYYGNSSAGGPSYRCSELAGVFCTSGETCTGKTTQTLDGADCCVDGSCKKVSSGSSKAWIGYLLAGIIILAGLILYLKYKKTGTPTKNPMKSRLSQIEKKMP